MFLCYFWLIAGILLFFLITEWTRGDGPHAVGPAIWQLFSRHKPAYSSFPHETHLQASTFFFAFIKWWLLQRARPTLFLSEAKLSCCHVICQLLSR